MCRSPVLVALLHEMLNEQTFDQFADLTAELKCRAARLRIPYDASRITVAFCAVAQSGPLLRPAPRTREPEPDPKPITRDEATDLLARLFALEDRTMRKWMRSAHTRMCGLCRTAIRVGEVFQMIEIGLTIRLPRCAECIGQPP